MANWIRRVGLVAAFIVALLGMPEAGLRMASAQDIPRAATPDEPTSSAETMGAMTKQFDWVDTSSPRATLRSLITGTRRYYDLIRKEGYTRRNRNELSNIITQSKRLFDLRNVPPGYSREIAYETPAFIRAALARVPLPDMSKVPDEEEMAARVRDGKSLVYRVPGTPFEIARTDAGPEAGRYQFTQDTISHARDFFQEIRDYPVQPEQADMEGLYEAYFMSPGPMIPFQWVRRLPSWMQIEIFKNRVWQWLLFMATVVVSAVGVFLLDRFVKRLAYGLSQLNRNMLLLARPIAVIALAYGLEEFFLHHVHVMGELGRSVVFAKHLVVLFASVMLTMVVGNVLAEFVAGFRYFKGQQLDQQLVRLLIRLVSVVIAVVIVIEELHQIGFSLATLVAGAGVGGLAIALAVQDTLKNIFAGIELALDKPFVVGQRVKMKEYEGDIEEIGLRSTKVRTLAGHQVVIPNQDLARLDVENVGRRPHIRRRFSITITYDTPPIKIGRAVEILKEILSIPEVKEESPKPHPNEAVNQPDYPPRVYFDDFNPDSLNILVIYWYHPPELWDFLEHSHWINLQIVERFNAEGIDFAFPTQTLYHAGDIKRPLAIGTSRQSADVPARPDSEVVSPGGNADNFMPPRPEKEGESPAAQTEADILDSTAANDDEAAAADATGC